MTSARLPALPERFLIPATGEVVDLNRPAEVLDALEQVRKMRYELDQAKRVLESALLEESQRQGTRTLRYGNIEGVVVGGDKLDWDIDELWKLRDAGLPEDRLGALVKTEVSYKVDAAVARQLEGSNPEYQKIIARARHRVPAPFYVKVKRA